MDDEEAGVGLKSLMVLSGFFVLLFAVAGCEAEPVAEVAEPVGEVAVEPVADVVEPAADVAEVKLSWVMVEGRVLKNDVEVSKPSMKTISGRAVDVSMEGWDKDGVRSFILMDLTPVVVGKEVGVTGKVSVALEKEGTDKVVALVDERVKEDGVVKVPVKLNEDAYLFEFRFKVVAGE